MTKFTNGIYIAKLKGTIVLLSNVQYYEHVYGDYNFWIVTYEYEGGIYPKTMLCRGDLQHFVRVGSF